MARAGIGLHQRVHILKIKNVDEYRAAVERVFREQPLAPTARFHG